MVTPSIKWLEELLIQLKAKRRKCMYLIYLIDTLDEKEVQTKCKDLNELGKFLSNLDTERYFLEGVQQENIVDDMQQFLKKTPGLEHG